MLEKEWIKMKNLITNILLGILEILFLIFYGYVVNIMINYFIPLSFSINQINKVSFVFILSYIVIIPLSLILLKKIKEMM